MRGMCKSLKPLVFTYELHLDLGLGTFGMDDITGLDARFAGDAGGKNDNFRAFQAGQEFVIADKALDFVKENIAQFLLPFLDNFPLGSLDQ